MKFQFKGFNRLGKVVDGALEASSQAECMEKLKAQQIRPTHLVLLKGAESEAKGSSFSFSSTVFGFNSAKPSLTEMTSFVRQLATMIGAGIPIVQSISVLAAQVDNRFFGFALSRVQARIEEGTSLADSMRKEGDVFDRIFTNLIAAGEVSGSLEKVLHRLAVYYEKSASLKRKIVSASTYPALIVVMVLGIVLGLLFFLVPTFADIFKQNNAKLPASTQFLLDLSGFLREYWFVVVGGILGTALSAYYLFTNEQFRMAMDPFLLRVPLFGEIFQKSATARFSRTLATMLQSGVPLLDAMEITASVAGNAWIEQAILNARKSIAEGSSISEPLERQKVFPKMVTSMMAVGEQSGSMDQMLIKIADFYEDEVEHKVGALTSILEPLLIFFVGGVVLGILIPLYLPLFKISEVAGGGQ